MYIIKCLDCNEEYHSRDIYNLYCENCENNGDNFVIKKWKVHGLLKDEIILKAIKINDIYQEDDSGYLYKEEHNEVIKLKRELVKYFEWCYEKFGIRCLEDMYYSFDDYCTINKKYIINPLTYCELSEKINWVN